MKKEDSGKSSPLSAPVSSTYGNVESGGHHNTNTTIQSAGDVTITYESAEKSPADQNPEPDTRSPYRGLRAFELRDGEKYFYGREAFVKILMGELETTNFVFVRGPSGSGKSSVVRAGLIYELDKTWGRNLFSLILFPKEDPFKSLHTSLSYIAGNQFSQSELQLAEVASQETLSQVVKVFKQKEPESFLLIFIDQFEELFTISDRQKSKCFIESLNHLRTELSRSQESNVKIVATMRADFDGHLSAAPYKKLVDATKPQTFITDMGDAELREAIEKPAAKHHVKFQEGLVDRIIEDVQGRAGYLALLQYTLDLLWKEEKIDEHSQNPVLTLATYQRLQGAQGVLQTRMNEFYQAHRSSEDVLRRVFLRLVDTNADGKSAIARRRVKRSQFTEDEQKIVTELVNAGFLVSNTSAVTEGNKSQAEQISTIEVAHEVLLTSWDKLKGWIDAHRGNIAFRNRVDEGLRNWQQKKSNDNLLHGSDLERALKLRNDEIFNDVIGGFSEDVEAFISASEKFQSWQKQQEKHRQKLFTLGLIGVSMLAGFAFYQLQQAQRQRVEQLAATSQALLDTQPVDATINALAAVGLSRSAFVQLPDRPQFASVEGSLLDAIQVNLERNRLLQTDKVYSVAISTDSKMIVTGREDGILQRWDAQTGRPIGEPLVGHEGEVHSVVISADGKTIISGSADETVRRWDAQTGRPIGEPLVGHKSVVRSVAISADGRMIASASWDGTVRRWDAQTGRSIGEPLVGHEDEVHSVAISADGKTIVSGSADETVRRWDAQTGRPIGEPLIGHESLVYSVAISADGKTIVSGSDDRTIQRWDAQTGEPIGQPLVGHKEAVISIAVSADSKTIVSGSQDNTIRRWDAPTGELIGQPLVGHTSAVYSIAISADGKTIVSSSQDNTVRSWNAQTGNLIEQLLEYENAIISVAISADGKTIVSGSDDRTIQRWDAQTGKPIDPPLEGHEDIVNSVAISADGKIIASGSVDKTIRLWNAETGKQIGQLSGHEDSVTEVAISADGKIIVSGSNDGTVRRWDAQTGKMDQLLSTEGSVLSIAISKDGKTIVSSSTRNQAGADVDVRRWDVQTGKPIGQPLLSKDAFYSVAISADGKTFITGSNNGVVQQWDVQTGKPTGQPFLGHTFSISSVAITADGKTIISSSDDGTIRFWDVQTRQSIGQLSRTASSMDISDDGKTIIGRNTRGIRVWQASLKNLLQAACGQLQHHSILVTPTTDVAKQARSTCENFVWSKSR